MSGCYTQLTEKQKRARITEPAGAASAVGNTALPPVYSTPIRICPASLPVFPSYQFERTPASCRASSSRSSSSRCTGVSVVVGPAEAARSVVVPAQGMEWWDSYMTALLPQ